MRNRRRASFRAEHLGATGDSSTATMKDDLITDSRCLKARPRPLSTNGQNAVQPRMRRDEEVVMRKTFVHTVLLGTLLLGVSAGTARAEETTRATLPFAFVVNGRTLPAGQYNVRISDDDPAVVMIDGISNPSAHAVVLTNPDYRSPRAGSAPELTFVRSGNQYRLATVWESGNYGRDVVAR